jgi:PKHD-type hydroxylase
MAWGLFPPNDIMRAQSIIACDVFNKEECDNIIKYSENLEKNKAEVFNSADNKITKVFETRKSTVSWIAPNSDTEWIYKKCTDLVNNINADFFKFDLNYIETLQFAFYDSKENNFYGKHVDQQVNYKKHMYRKLSFAIQLNDPSEYTGGEFITHLSNTPDVAQKQLGRGYFFPSFLLHEVTPVTSGSRYSLVGWVNGPYWK